MELTKVKIIQKKNAEILFRQKNDDGKTIKGTHESDGIPHPDFFTAMKSLRVHYAILTGYEQPKNVKKPEEHNTELIESFHVSGFSIHGKDEEDQAIIITGHRIHPISGKAIIINTPLTKLNEDEKTSYKFSEQLIEAVDQVKKEAKAYMGGKYEPTAQTALFDQKPELEEALK